MTQTEEDALICYIMSLQENKVCMGWWVGIAERVCREKWPEAFARLMEIHNKSLTK